MTLPPPFDLTLDEFLKGKDTQKNIDIDPIFGTSFLEFYNEHASYFPSDYTSNDTIFIVESRINPQISFYEIGIGVVAVLNHAEPIGCYLWSSLALDTAYQGQGLGRELVMTRLIRDGENPVWNLDTPAYSPAGLACHISAWTFVQQHWN